MKRVSKILPFSKNLYSRYRDDDVPALGAQLTYYFILSFFPFLIFVVSLMSFVQLSGDNVVAELIRLLPEQTGEAIQLILQEVTDNSRGTLLSIGMIATLWSASNGVNAVIKGVNKAYDVEENRPFWKVRAISLAATVVLALSILLAIVMLIFGEVIGEFLFDWFDSPIGFGLIWGTLKYVFPISFMIVVFSLLYWIVPNRKIRFKSAIPGALFATFGWIASSLLFQFYINNFSNYSKTYGSIGGIIILLIWLYISSNIIILGGEVNATLAGGQAKPFVENALPNVRGKQKPRSIKL
ncbi:YihY/virulence factor BrkB family protein [Paenibacillus glycanilyticus]|uniref:YihY/virulence factor BrkB family protein n=1 Tax=Paenibacillus glycanilyticus TaxID=126569 RepID=UPI00203FDA7B|nr:YihY/virulence factor BrkB family protein [Paenibacillus glycanilyticus]MCM3626170.1 YihY/virulence factor BrkB family protein [Paenibacillus glycanilyticus]